MLTLRSDTISHLFGKGAMEELAVKTSLKDFAVPRRVSFFISEICFGLKFHERHDLPITNLKRKSSSILNHIFKFLYELDGKASKACVGQLNNQR